MKNLYDVLKENPTLLNGLNLKGDDIAAANYLFVISGTLTRSEIRHEDDGAWVHTHSEYNETVAKIIESHPAAVKLILSLSQGYGIFTGGVDSQFAWLLVNDYLKHNFGDNKSRNNL